METRESVRWDDLVPIGRVARPQGRFGEVVLDAVADASALDHLQRVFVRSPDEGTRAIAVRSVRTHKGRPVLRLEGADDISEAERFSGVELRAQAQELGTLPDGRYFNYQLAGLEVWDPREGFVGVVIDCVSTGASDLLVGRTRAPKKSSSRSAGNCVPTWIWSGSE